MAREVAGDAEEAMQNRKGVNSTWSVIEPELLAKLNLDPSGLVFEATRDSAHARVLTLGEECNLVDGAMASERLYEVIALQSAYIPNVEAKKLLSTGDYEAIAAVARTNDGRSAAVGCCTYRAHGARNGGPGFIELSLFCVDVACQGKGLGRALMRELERVALSKHKAQLVLAYADTKAFSFFRRQQFTRQVRTSHAVWKSRIVCYEGAVIVEKLLEEREQKALKRATPNMATPLLPPVVGCTSGRPRCYCRTGRTRAIERYDPKTNQTLERYCSASDAARKLDLPACSVTHVTNGHAHSARGHFFRYVEDLPFLNGGAREVVRVKVVMDDLGPAQPRRRRLEVIARYSSCKDAARKLFADGRSLNGAIGAVCNGQADQVNGHIFRWAELRVHPCAICRFDTDADSLLLCDGIDGRCTATAHTKCLGLNAVPDGEWFCEACEKRRLGGYDVTAAVPHSQPRGFSDAFLNERRAAIGLGLPSIARGNKDEDHEDGYFGLKRSVARSKKGSAKTKSSVSVNRDVDITVNPQKKVKLADELRAHQKEKPTTKIAGLASSLTLRKRKRDDTARAALSNEHRPNTSSVRSGGGKGTVVPSSRFEYEFKHKGDARGESAHMSTSKVMKRLDRNAPKGALSKKPAAIALGKEQTMKKNAPQARPKKNMKHSPGPKKNVHIDEAKAARDTGDAGDELRKKPSCVAKGDAKCHLSPNTFKASNGRKSTQQPIGRNSSTTSKLDNQKRMTGDDSRKNRSMMALKCRKIRVQQQNPKRPNSKSWKRYEQYKIAVTTHEYIALGGTRADLAFDEKRGYVCEIKDHNLNDGDDGESSEKTVGCAGGYSSSVDKEAKIHNLRNNEENRDKVPLKTIRLINAGADDCADVDFIEFCPDNPFRAGTAQFERYETYKSAGSLGSFFELGGTRNDLNAVVKAGSVSHLSRRAARDRRKIKFDSISHSYVRNNDDKRTNNQLDSRKRNSAVASFG